MKKSLPLAFILSLSMLAACSPSDSGGGSATSSSSAAMAQGENCDTKSTWAWDGALVEGKHTVVLCTNMGNITLELDGDNAPKTATNFMALAASGYYDKLTFHRVIPGFMIQGGDPNGNGTGGHSIFGDMFEDEIKPSSALYKKGYVKGVIAMANRGPNTNGSQFFIMDADYPLPPSYTIFGHVTAGQEVVNKIATTDRDTDNDMPLKEVVFSVKVVK